MFKEKIREDSANGWNVHDHLKNMSVEEINEWCEPHRLSFSVCLLSITGDLNIGVMIRTAHNLGASSVITIGRRIYDKRSTVGSHNYIPLHRINGFLPNSCEIDVNIFSKTMKDFGLFPIFIETGGEDLGTFSWKDKLSKTSLTPCFVFGSEGEGISDDILSTKEEFRSFIVGIPQRGAIRSFNVSAAGAIVLWDFVKEIY